MARKYIPMAAALEQAREAYPYLTEDDGITACYDIENMGWCKDHCTRWYHFTSVDGEPAYTLRH